MVWAAVSTIISSGNWNDATIWNGGNIADDISKDVEISDNTGIVTIQNGDSYVIGDISMSNGNTLTIDAGGFLFLGSAVNPKSLNAEGNTTLNVDGELEIFGDLIVMNDFVLNVTGELTIRGDLKIKNTATIDIQGAVFIEGDFIGKDFNNLNVDGALIISDDLIMGLDPILTGTGGTVSIGGGCTGPLSFCDADLIIGTIPIISDCPIDISVSLPDTGCTVSVSWIEPIATNSISLVSNYIPGDQFPIDTTTVIYTATDAGGTTATCSFNIYVADDTSPVIVNCPTDIIFDISDIDCDRIVTWIAPSASDNCQVDQFTSTKVPGEEFPFGTTTVVYTATDLVGNMTTCSFNVIVTDITPPVITNCPTNIIFDISDIGCDRIVTWIAPSATDNCQVDQFTSTKVPGDEFPLGTTTVVYTATDLAGNFTTCSFNVTVRDLTAPKFDICPFEVVIGEFDLINQNAVVTWKEPIVSDNCDIPVVSSNYKSGATLPPGITTITYTATDQSGNVAVCEFEVNVIGNKVPTATSPLFIEVFTGMPVEFCLEVRDPDGDDLVIADINYATINGTIENSGSDKNLCLKYTSFSDFEGKERIFVTVCDNGSPTACVEVEVSITVAYDLELTFYKAFTPNGDNLNDLWIIENIESFPRNRVIIYDRSGGTIYSATGYNNTNIVWDGRSNQNGQEIVESGTYFYKIDLGNGDSSQKGYIELIR